MPLHERIRKLIPSAIESRIPEKLKPPAWRAPVVETPEWAKEKGRPKWALGTPARALDDVNVTEDSKGRALRGPFTIARGTTGTVTAVGPSWVVFQPEGLVGFRVYAPNDHLEPLIPEKERKWGRGPIEVTAEDAPAVEEMTWQELPVAIEVRGGEVRHPGDRYEVELPEEWVGYGFFEGVEGEDGDSLDVIAGPSFPEGRVFIAEQKNARSGERQQVKVMIGFADENAARNAFLVMWPATMLGGLAERTPDEMASMIRGDGRVAAKPKQCSHCGRDVAPSEVFGSEGRWLHRDCVSSGPIEVTAEQLTRGQYRELVHRSVRAKELGTIGELVVWRVDGTWVRDHIDVDYVAGGNSGRYAWIPDGEVWIEKDLGEKDMAATIVHEVVECRAMAGGADYETAHDEAAGVEREFRLGSENGNPFKAAERFLSGEDTEVGAEALEPGLDNAEEDEAAWADEARRPSLPGGLGAGGRVGRGPRARSSCDDAGLRPRGRPLDAPGSDRALLRLAGGLGPRRGGLAQLQRRTDPARFLTENGVRKTGAVEVVADDLGWIEVTAASLGGLELKRKGYQRYVAEWTDTEGDVHKVWIGGEHKVEHGSYGGNARQRRKTLWVVKVDGEEIGEEKSLKAARELAEAHLGIAPAAAAAPTTVVPGQPASFSSRTPAVNALAPPPTGPDPLAALRIGTIEVDASMLVDAKGRGKKAPTPKGPGPMWLPGGPAPMPSRDLRLQRHVVPSRPGRDPELGPEREPMRVAPEEGPSWWVGHEPPASDRPGGHVQPPPLPAVTEVSAPSEWLGHEPPVVHRDVKPANIDFDPRVHLAPEFAPPPKLTSKEKEERGKLPPLEPTPPLPEGSVIGPKPERVSPAVVERTYAELSLTPNGGYQNIVNLLRKARPEEMEFYAKWYDHAHEDIQELAARYGKPVHIVAALVAVLSPNMPWEKNLEQAERVLQGQPRTSAYPENTAKAYHILRTGDVSVLTSGAWGPKVGPFFESIAAPMVHRRKVVIDGHAANIWRGSYKQLQNSTNGSGETIKGVQVSDRQRAEMQQDYQRAGDAFGITPQAAQAITWSIWRELVERNQREERAQRRQNRSVEGAASSGGSVWHDVPYQGEEREPTNVGKLRLRPNGGRANISKVVRMATASEREFWSKWYPMAGSVLREMAGRYSLPFETVAGVVAVLSPGNTWPNNINAAKKLIGWWKGQQEYGPFSTPALSGVGGPGVEVGSDDIDSSAARAAQLGQPYAFEPAPTQPKSAPATVLKQRRGPKQRPTGFFGPPVSTNNPGNVAKAVRILNGEAPEAVISGPKVEMFYATLVDPSRVTKPVLDGHAINLWRGEKRPLKGIRMPTAEERARMERDYEGVATELGMTVHGLQALTWFLWRSVEGDARIAVHEGSIEEAREMMGKGYESIALVDGSTTPLYLGPGEAEVLRERYGDAVTVRPLGEYVRTAHVEVTVGDLGFVMTADRERRRQFAGEVYYLPKHDWLACARLHDAGDGAEEIRFTPSARILRGASGRMNEVLAKARAEGWDAVRVGERLAVLNEAAILSRQPVRRDEWLTPRERR